MSVYEIRKKLIKFCRQIKCAELDTKIDSV